MNKSKDGMQKMKGRERPMIMKKRVTYQMLAVLAAAVLCVGILTACGGGGSSTQNASSDNDGQQQAVQQQSENNAAGSTANKSVMGVNVVDLLTCDVQEAYEQLSAIPNISPADVDGFLQNSEMINFSNNPKLLEALEIAYETESNGSDLDENEDYQQICSELSTEQVELFTFGEHVLMRDNFSTDTMPSLSGCGYYIYIPAGNDISCESIAEYVNSIAPYDQCYIVQTDAHVFGGAAKGKGCLSGVAVVEGSFPLSGYIPFGTTHSYTILISTYSLFRDSNAETLSSDFDSEYNSINPANYIDTYIQ